MVLISLDRRAEKIISHYIGGDDAGVVQTSNFGKAAESGKSKKKCASKQAGSTVIAGSNFFYLRPCCFDWKAIHQSLR